MGRSIVNHRTVIHAKKAVPGILRTLLFTNEGVVFAIEELKVNLFAFEISDLQTGANVRGLNTQ